MTKTQLVAHIQDYCDENDVQLSKAQITGVLEGLEDAALATVEDVGKVTIPGIGRISCTLRKRRKGRNPATGEEIQIEAKVAVRISPVKTLKEAVPSVQVARNKLKKK